MIKMSVKGLAKFMTASPSGQRRILREFKFPDEDEPRAMRLYYGEATDAIKAYHANGKARQWLHDQADALSQLAVSLGGQSAIRLRNNARGLRQYADNFSRRRFDVLPDLRMELVYEDVRITVVPDLHVSERGKEKILKLDFTSRTADAQVIRIVSQCMFEAFRTSHGSITSSSVLYLEVANGTEHHGARIGARLLGEVKAACDNINALWGTITQ